MSIAILYSETNPNVYNGPYYQETVYRMSAYLCLLQWEVTEFNGTEFNVCLYCVFRIAALGGKDPVQTPNS